MKHWKTKNQKYVLQTKWMSLRRDEVIRPDGTDGEYYILEKRDFVVVIAKLGESFILVEQERYPVGSLSLEFSQGVMEEGEKPEEAARREYK